MRTHLLLAFAALLLLPLIGTAQEFPAVTASIPFQFRANGVVLPASSYEFRITGEDMNELLVTNTRTGRGVFVSILAPVNVDPSGKPEVIFDRQGGTYSLSEVIVPGLEGCVVPQARLK
jgi:hypothetical protein